VREDELLTAFSGTGIGSGSPAASGWRAVLVELVEKVSAQMQLNKAVRKSL
jgi:hypothetical protein